MTVCIIGASFETGNMGVGALTAGAIRCILHRWPKASVFLLDYGKTAPVYTHLCEGQQVIVPLVNIRFSKKIYLPNNIAYLLCLAALIRAIPSNRLRRILTQRNRCLKALAQADIVASLAGGDSFSDTYGFQRLIYVSLPQILAIFMRKRLILLPQTLGPFEGRAAKALGRFILMRADMVYSRDRQGVQFLDRWLGSAGMQKARFGYDVGFVIEPIRPNHTEIIGLSEKQGNAPCVVGLNISGLLFPQTPLQHTAFGLGRVYEEVIYGVIDRLAQKENASVLLIPHVFGESAEADVSACERVYQVVNKQYGEKIRIIRGVFDQNEIKYIIGSCDVFVGSRMHACIAALSQYIPTVPIAYSDKFIGVLETVCGDKVVADLRYMAPSAVVTIVDGVFEKRAAFRMGLERSIPLARKVALEIFDDWKDVG